MLPDCPSVTALLEEFRVREFNPYSFSVLAHAFLEWRKEREQGTKS